MTQPQKARGNTENSAATQNLRFRVRMEYHAATPLPKSPYTKPTPNDGPRTKENLRPTKKAIAANALTTMQPTANRRMASGLMVFALMGLASDDPAFLLWCLGPASSGKTRAVPDLGIMFDLLSNDSTHRLPPRTGAGSESSARKSQRAFRNRSAGGGACTADW